MPVAAQNFITGYTGLLSDPTLNSSSDAPSTLHRPHLQRGFGLLQATALNMSKVVGVGPFITIPLILTTMGGPQALLGWVLGAMLAICDGQIWSELGAAWPGSVIAWGPGPRTSRDDMVTSQPHSSAPRSTAQPRLRPRISAQIRFQPHE